MKWIVHLTVVLLNVLWVAFFLTDPLAVFVQKRSSSSSEETMVGEFCLQTPSDLKWKPAPGTFDVSADQTRTTDPNREKKNTPDETHTEPKHLNSSQLPEIRAPTASSTVRDLNETTTATPPVQKPTSAAGTSELELISNGKSEAAPVRTTKSSIPPVIQRNRQDQWHHGGMFGQQCLCQRLKNRIISKAEIKEIQVYKATIFCAKVEIVVTQKNGFRYCLNPELAPVKKLMEIMAKKQKSLPSDLTWTRSVPTSIRGRRGYRGGGRSRGSYRRRPGVELGAGPNYGQYSSSHRGRGQERSYSLSANERRGHRDLNETTPPMQKPTSAAGTSELELISNGKSEAAPVRMTKSLKPPVTQIVKQNQPRTVNCCLGYSSTSIPLSRIKEYYVQHEGTCPIKAVILTTTRGKKICANPDIQWVKRFLEI